MKCHSCLTSDQSNFWAFLSKMSEFRPKSVKGNLVPLHSKFEVRNMVPRNCVKTKFWKKWITLGMNYGWRPLKCCSVQNWTSFKTGEQFLPNWPKFSWLRKVYQTCIVSKFHVAPGKFQYRHMPEYCRNLFPVSEAKISVHLSKSSEFCQRIPKLAPHNIWKNSRKSLYWRVVHPPCPLRSQHGEGIFVRKDIQAWVSCVHYAGNPS